MELESNYRRKVGDTQNMETKQHATKQPMEQQRNKRGNLKVPRNK